MTPEDRSQGLRAALGDWQKRHGLADHDPLLGVVELFELFLGSLGTGTGSNSQKLWEELCGSMELLTQRCKALSKQIEEMPAGICRAPDPNAPGGPALLLGIILFGAGVALGRWFV